MFHLIVQFEIMLVILKLILFYLGIRCLQPYRPENSTLHGLNYIYEANVTITCFDGHYLNQTSRPDWNAEVIQCSSNQQWSPDPYELACARKLIRNISIFIATLLQLLVFQHIIVGILVL